MGRSGDFIRSKTFPLVVAWIGILVLSVVVEAPNFQWTITPLPQDYVVYSSFKSVFPVAENDVWAVGSTFQAGGSIGTIVRWDGENWRTVSGAASELNYVTMLSADYGWAVGEKGTTLRWNGSNWSQAQAPTANALNSVYILSSTESWAAGGGGTILRWDGENWLQVECPTANDLDSISMLSPSDGWAVGAGGVILRWDGENWSGIPSPTANNLASVCMLSSNDGWAVGSGGTILKWDGAKWSAMKSPLDNSVALNSIHMLSPNEGWAVGASGGNGVILRWDGLGWLYMGQAVGIELDSIRMISSERGFAASNSWIFLKWGTAGEKSYPNMFFIALWISVLYILVRGFFTRSPAKNKIPVMTIGFITANILIFVLIGSSIFVVSSYGLRPAVVLQGQNPASFLTSMFIHADYNHLGGNMLCLLVFGSLIEPRCTRKRFLLIYFLAGFLASSLDIWARYDSGIPAIGASGAIAGIIGAVAFNYPPLKAPAPLLAMLVAPIFTFFLPSLAAPVVSMLVIALALYLYGRSFVAFPFLFAWFFYQFGRGLAAFGGGVVGIAYWAHVGGFIGGLFLYHFLKKPEPEEPPKHKYKIFPMD